MSQTDKPNSNLNMTEFNDRFQIIYEFCRDLEFKFNPPYSNFIFPNLINPGYDADGIFHSEEEIDLEWSDNLNPFHLLLTFGKKPDSEGNTCGGFGQWNDLSHSIFINWKGRLKDNPQIANELYRFFLPNLAIELKKPVNSMNHTEKTQIFVLYEYFRTFWDNSFLGPCETLEEAQAEIKTTQNKDPRTRNFRILQGKII